MVWGVEASCIEVEGLGFRVLGSRVAVLQFRVHSLGVVFATALTSAWLGWPPVRGW